MFHYNNKIFLSLIFLFLPLSFCRAQWNSISTKLLYINSSRIYIFPEASDLILRKKHFPIENIWGISFEYRRTLNENQYAMGINVDYIKKTVELNIFSFTDGFWALPIELTGYFFIPLGIERWKIFMGGGAGIYIGGRLLKKENISESSSKYYPGYGIHILGGVEYILHTNFALKTQMKFRDLYFKTSNKFYSQQNDFNNNSSMEYKSRISVDGIILELGILYSF